MTFDRAPSWRTDTRSAAKRGYSYRWQKARATFLKRHPLCVMCEKEGRVTLGGVVDHIIPHEGDHELFWDTDNWQTLCRRHHSSDKQALEKSGRVRVAVGLDGYPLGQD